MKRKVGIATVILFGVFFLSFFTNKRKVNLWDKTTPVAEILMFLGDNLSKDFEKKYTEEQIKQGEELIEKGRTKIGRKRKSTYISKFFVCTDCHNTVQEDPNLAVSDPQARLEYAVEKNIPFLQATTFYGVINRESWYNEDYVLKYGDLVKPAKNNLNEAIQLCAKYCSSGRYLEQWELDAIMAYYQSKQLVLGDLNLSQDTWDRVFDASRSRRGDLEQELIKEIKAAYLSYSPANFVDAPKDKQTGYPGLTGNAGNGQLIYKKSCQTCHRKNGPSQVILDDAKFTFKKLKNNITKHNDFSIYQITRYGTHAEHGHMQYMPLYTAERLSHQQVEDLKAYIEKMAQSKIF